MKMNFKTNIESKESLKVSGIQPRSRSDHQALLTLKVQAEIELQEHTMELEEMFIFSLEPNPSQPAPSTTTCAPLKLKLKLTFKPKESFKVGPNPIIFLKVGLVWRRYRTQLWREGGEGLERVFWLRVGSPLID